MFSIVNDVTNIKQVSGPYKENILFFAHRIEKITKRS